MREREDVHTNPIARRELPQFVRTISHFVLGLIVSPLVIYFGSQLFGIAAMEVAKSLVVFEAITSIPFVFLLGLSLWLLFRRPRLRPFASGMLAGLLAMGVLSALTIAFEL
jgi:hypothetical protein